MIKKYNQFVKNVINESSDFDSDQIEDTYNNDQNPGIENIEEEGEEGGDVYNSKLKDLATKLGVSVENGSINYMGKKIIFPSETEMFHIGNKKFKTSEEVISFLMMNKKSN